MANKVPLVIADFETQLSGAISVGDTSFTLASATDDDGNALAAGMYCFTVNNGRSNKQYLLGQLNGTAVTSVVSVDRRGNETAGSAYAARSGSPVIITDFATIQRVADILRGQETLDGDNPVYYDAEPSLASREELATVGYVLDNVNGGTVSFDNQIISSSDATAGETVAVDDWVFFQTSDQEWYQADADTAAEVENVQLGVALGAGSDGVSISGGVQIGGVYTTSGLTAGDTYYISNTAGEITNSAGTNKMAVGVALSSTKLLLSLGNVNSPTSDEKDAMAGVNNAPDSSNPFVTADDLSDPTIKPPQVVTFTSSGTWTKDAGLKYVVVELVGGGGSGFNNQDGAGGGAGGYSREVILASALSATETVTVGSGGATASAAAGGTTSFGSLLQATGGAAATVGDQEDGGAGGVGSGGDINFTGATGHVSTSYNLGDGTNYRGIGGASYLGVGANSGAGGNGGSDGEDGIVIVTEYYS